MKHDYQIYPWERQMMNPWKQMIERQEKRNRDHCLLLVVVVIFVLGLCV